MTTKKKNDQSNVFSDEKIKHLEFIQSNVERMGSNSFKIKTSAITFVAASILSSTQNPKYAIASIPAVILFWFMDSYYLWQERKFRGLYNDAAGISNNFEIKIFAMPIHLYRSNQYSFMNVFYSVTILPLYLFTTLILLMIYFIV